MLNRYFSAWILGVFFCNISLQAVEAVIETDAPSKVQSAKKKTAKKDINAPVSIDALVVKYQEASEEEAYKIMNQIKQQIAQMSQQRQVNAIGKVRQTADEKSRIKKKVDKKQKKKKQKTSIKKQSKKHLKKSRKQKKNVHKKYKKQKKSALETISQTSYNAAHPDPVSVMNGISDSSGTDSHSGTSPGGGMGDFGGGSGMGGMGGF